MGFGMSALLQNIESHVFAKASGDNYSQQPHVAWQFKATVSLPSLLSTKSLAWLRTHPKPASSHGLGSQRSLIHLNKKRYHRSLCSKPSSSQQRYKWDREELKGCDCQWGTARGEGRPFMGDVEIRTNRQKPGRLSCLSRQPGCLWHALKETFPSPFCKDTSFNSANIKSSKEIHCTHNAITSLQDGKKMRGMDVMTTSFCMRGKCFQGII